jgi:hypothetical protein
MDVYVTTVIYERSLLHEEYDLPPHVYAFSTLERAKAAGIYDPGVVANTAWKHFDTDQEGVELWRCKCISEITGVAKRVTVTKYPLDMIPPFSVGVE